MLKLKEKKHLREQEEQKAKSNILHSFARELHLINDDKKKNEEKDFMYFLTDTEIKEVSKSYIFENLDDKNIINKIKNSIIQSYKRENCFYQILKGLMIKKGMKKESDLCKNAEVSRKVLCSIRSHEFYCPKKRIVMAFVVALRLNEEEAYSLLSSASIAFSPSRADDTFYDFLIRSDSLKNPVVNVKLVNELLNELGLPLLGSTTKKDTEDTEATEGKKSQEKPHSKGAIIKR